MMGVLENGFWLWAAFLAATFGRRQMRQNPLPNVEVARYLGSRGVSDGQLRNLHQACFNRINQSKIADHPRKGLVRFLSDSAQEIRRGRKVDADVDPA